LPLTNLSYNIQYVQRPRKEKSFKPLTPIFQQYHGSWLNTNRQPLSKCHCQSQTLYHSDVSSTSCHVGTSNPQQ